MAATMLCTTSCESDIELASQAGETSTVSFNVGTPEKIVSRAFSDGLTATRLQYAVYDAEGNEIEGFTVTDGNIQGSTTVNLQLTTGKTYSVAFWATATDAPYTVDFSAKTMSVTYQDAKSNAENRDAFYKYETFTVTGTMTKTIELKRPFAQLNIGTGDLTASTAAGYTPTQSWVSFPVYTTLNFADGTVTGQQAQKFDLADLPKGETFPVDGYDYLSMNYLLVAADKEVVDVEFGFTDGSTAMERKVGSVPVQRNYRTNIYGQLLTSGVNINVEIEPDYEEPDYNLYNVVVDGVSYDDFTVAVAKALELAKPVEFIQNVSIDADNTITIPEGQTLTLNLNGYTLQGVTDDADKNDDGRITSSDNEVMFDVRGVMNVSGGRVTIKHTDDADYANFSWNACGEIFYVAGNGTLNVADAHLENEGGIPMAYAIDLINAANVTLDVDNSTLKSSYIPVRVFNNSSTGMNNVTIKNSTLEGTSLAFWVHLYTQADDKNFFSSGKDTNSNGYKDETLNINIYNPTCNNTFIANNPERIIGYGFTDRIYLREDGYQSEDIVAVGNAEDLKNALTQLTAGSTVVLDKDIDLTNETWEVTAPWQGSSTSVVFDGGGHKITGLTTSGLQGGLFGKFNSNGDITIKNLTLENVTITGTDVDGESAGGALIGWIENHGAGTITVENVKVEGIKAEGFKYTGGLIGYFNGSSELKLVGCSVNGTTESQLNSTYNESGNYKGHIGGLLGLWSKGTINACEVKNLAIKHGTTDMTGSSNRAGALVGTKYSGVTVNSATVENVTVDGDAVTAASLFGPNASSATDTDKANVTIK